MSKPKDTTKNEIRVKLYNKGNRDWDLKDVNKLVKFEKGTHKDFNKSAADKLIANYPKDFVLAGDSPTKLDSEKLRKENKALKGQLERAKGGLEKLEELEKENSDLKTELEQVKQELEEAKKALSLPLAGKDEIPENKTGA